MQMRQVLEKRERDLHEILSNVFNVFDFVIIAAYESRLRKRLLRDRENRNTRVFSSLKYNE